MSNDDLTAYLRGLQRTFDEAEAALGELGPLAPFSLHHATGTPPAAMVTNTDGSMAVPEGRVVIAGRSKIGKTTLAAGIVVQRLALDRRRLAVVVCGAGESGALDWSLKLDSFTRAASLGQWLDIRRRTIVVPWHHENAGAVLEHLIRSVGYGAARFDLVIDSATSLVDDINSQAETKKLADGLAALTEAATSTITVAHQGHAGARTMGSTALLALADATYLLTGTPPTEETGADWQLRFDPHGGSRVLGPVGADITSDPLGPEGLVLTWSRPGAGGDPLVAEAAAWVNGQPAGSRLSKNAVHQGLGDTRDKSPILRAVDRASAEGLIATHLGGPHPMFGPMIEMT